MVGTPPTEIDDHPSNERFKKSGINISYAADSTSRALRATCLSLPIDKQSFYLAMRFLQCVKLTEENKFILQTTLTKDDRIWIKEKESQAIPIGVICPR
ncbi:hypothetical protein [Candidatus Coxiella mudrowiae]|uniref:hypothetical protein n=1 Tax=Candidatus Coxiella mudrowiae TaxID=2054173 RepID=UPI000662147D|nr:hypothetical protein [Candidatus Coxiella mudrowiae]